MSLTKATYSMIRGAPVNPTSFGAVGDGVADDSDSLILAITEADGKTLDFGGQTYKITKAVNATVSNGIELQNGKIICDYDSQGDLGVGIATSGDVKISNLTVDGQNTVAKIFRISSEGSGVSVQVDNFTGKNALQTADTGLAACLYMTGSTGTFDVVQVTNSKFTNADSTGGSQVGRGLMVEDAAKTLVNNCHFEDIGPYQDGDGVYVANPVGDNEFLISNCSFLNCQKRSIKSQVQNTVVSNIIAKRTSAFTAAAGQSEIDLQRSGIIDGVTFYYDDGCAPSFMLSAWVTTDEDQIAVRNITVEMEDPADIVQFMYFFQAQGIYAKNSVFENISGNCVLDSLIYTRGDGFDTNPGSFSEFLFQNIILRDIYFPNGFNPSPSVDATSGQFETGLFRATRSAIAYIQVSFSAYNVHIGTDDTVQTAYLDTQGGSLVYLQVKLNEWTNCKGFDTTSYDGTGTGTFNSTYVYERTPELTGFYSRRFQVNSDSTFSQSFTIPNEGGCKVSVIYGGLNTPATDLYTEGFIVRGGDYTAYYESVSGIKSATESGSIAISVTGSDANFTVSKTAGTLSSGGGLQIIVVGNRDVVEI